MKIASYSLTLATIMLLSLNANSQLSTTYPCDTPGEVATGKIADQSTTFLTNTANLAVDGVISLNSTSRTTDGQNSWLEVDLGAAYQLQSIKIWYPVGEAMSNYYILFSETPFSSQNLAQELSSPEVDYLHIESPIPSGQALPLNLGNNTQYVRIQNAGGGSVIVSELQIPGGGGNEEICGNGIDDNCDGRSDCEDSHCAAHVSNVDVSQQPSCLLCYDGSITINPPMNENEYSIDGGVTFQNSNHFGNLLPNNYNIVVRNKNTGCTFTKTVSLPPTQGDPNGCCDNGDFESGTFNNWTGSSGRINSDGDITVEPIELNENGGTSCTSCVISTNGNYQDALVPNLPVLNTSSGDFISKLSRNELAFVSTLAYEFVVDECNKTFRFNYLIVAEDPVGQHDADENGSFRYKITKLSTNEVIFQRTIFAATDETEPFFNTLNDDDDPLIVFTNWECEAIDLSPHLNENMKIEFLSASCFDGAHGSYTYIDGLCNSAGDMTPVVDIELPQAFCNGQQIIVDASESLGYTTHGWTVCELSSTGTEINCVEYSGLSHGILGLFDVNSYYTNGGFTLQCGRMYRIKLTLANDCAGELTESVDFDYRCESFPPLTYRDVFTCNSTDVDIQMKSDDPICSNCEYLWSPATPLDLETIQFPTITGETNTNAFDSDFHVVAKNEFGCVQEDDIKVYTPDFTLEAMNVISDDNICNYELNALLSSVESILFYAGVSVICEFVNITKNQTFPATIIYQVDNSIKFKLAGQSFSYQEDGDVWKVRVEVVFDPVLYVTAENCILEEPFEFVEGSTLYTGPMLFAMPTAFSPNGDGDNDFFRPVVAFPPLERWRKLNATWGRLRVWDRWGEMVCDRIATGTPGNPFGPEELEWDGTYNEILMPQDVYIYSIEFKNCTFPEGGSESCHGWCIGEGNSPYGNPCDDDDDCNILSSCSGCEWSGDVTLCTAPDCGY